VRGWEKGPKKESAADGLTNCGANGRGPNGEEGTSFETKGLEKKWALGNARGLKSPEVLEKTISSNRDGSAVNAKH